MQHLFQLKCFAKLLYSSDWAAPPPAPFIIISQGVCDSITYRSRAEFRLLKEHPNRLFHVGTNPPWIIQRNKDTSFVAESQPLGSHYMAKLGSGKQWLLCSAQTHSDSQVIRTNRDRVFRDSI
jgi:hypothetical protein